MLLVPSTDQQRRRNALLPRPTHQGNVNINVASRSSYERHMPQPRENGLEMLDMRPCTSTRPPRFHLPWAAHPVHDRPKRPFSAVGVFASCVASCLPFFPQLQASAADGDVSQAPEVRIISPALGLFDVLVPDAAHPAEWIEVVGADSVVQLRVPLRQVALRAGDPIENAGTRSARLLLDGLIEPASWADLTVRVEGAAISTRLELVKPEDPIRAVPSWALGATWYQIFPERFRNGDPANDPTPPGTSLVPWNSDFASVTNDEIELAWSRQRAGVRSAAASFNRRGGARRATIYNRRYGGDLQGVVQQLDHIKSLGVTAIYLCPVFASSSLHKYDARDFRHIDPTFGPVDTRPAEADTWHWTAADRYFVEVLLPEARKRGLRVVLDGVWNHTGTDFWAFQDLVSRGAESPYRNWFRSRFDASGNLVGWEGWDSRNGNLPEFQQTTDGDLVPEVSDHIFDVTTRWMDPNGDGDPSDGIDGWRLDVAPEIGTAFWSRWRSHVRSINPNAALYGEIWFDAAPWFSGVAFDAQMNYPFAYAVVEWASGAPRTSASALADRLQRVFNHAPATDLAQMNLLDSHDTARLLTMMAHPGTSYDDGTTSADLGSDSVSVRPKDEHARRAMLAVALQVAAPGSPMIFAGDELGAFGPDDPDNRKPIQWPDLSPPANPADAPDLQLLDEYRRWFALRQHPTWGPVLRYGTVRSLASYGDDVIVIVRDLNNHSVTIVVNRGRSEFDASIIESADIADSRNARVAPLKARWFVRPTR